MDQLTKLFYSLGLSPYYGIFVAAFLLAVIILAFALLYEGVATYVERKVAGDIQSRIGPNRVGPYGTLQWLADGVKLFLKEDFIPAQADKLIFRIAPYFVFVGSFLPFAALPLWDRFVPVPMNIGLLYIIAVTAMVTPGIVLAGWGSNNKWALLGGMRSAAQLISYEVPNAVALLIPVLIAGTLNLDEIVRAQGGGGGILRWFIFHDPFSFMAFFIFFTAGLAECNRTPFDLPEAESELVAGYSVEYSAIRYAFFYMGEYGDMFIISAMASAAFLGGWQLPLIDPLVKIGWLKAVLQLGIFLTKTLLLVLVMMWIRWTFPRLRVDQLMELSWKRLLPIALFLLMGAALWTVVFHGKGIYDLIVG